MITGTVKECSYCTKAPTWIVLWPSEDARSHVCDVHIGEFRNSTRLPYAVELEQVVLV